MELLAVCPNISRYIQEAPGGRTSHFMSLDASAPRSDVWSHPSSDSTHLLYVECDFQKRPIWAALAWFFSQVHWHTGMQRVQRAGVQCVQGAYTYSAHRRTVRAGALYVQARTVRTGVVGTCGASPPGHHRRAPRSHVFGYLVRVKR